MPDVAQKPDRTSASIGRVLCRSRCPPSQPACIAWSRDRSKDSSEPGFVDIMMMNGLDWE